MRRALLSLSLPVLWVGLNLKRTKPQGEIRTKLRLELWHERGD